MRGQKGDVQHSLLKEGGVSKSECATKRIPKVVVSIQIEPEQRRCQNSAWTTSQRGKVAPNVCSFHYIALYFSGLSFSVTARLWSICNDNLIMSAMSKYVCYPSTQRSPHYTCLEGWCPSHGAHWSHIRQDLGVAYTLWLKVNIFCLLWF